MAQGPGIKLGPRWWKASALPTAPVLPPTDAGGKMTNRKRVTSRQITKGDLCQTLSSKYYGGSL